MSKVKGNDISNILDLLVAYMQSTNSIATAIRETGDTFSQYKNTFDIVADDIERNGTDLKVALNREDVFPEEVTTLIDAGSQSGKLTEVLPEVSKSIKFMTRVSSGIANAVRFQVGLLFTMIATMPYLLMLVAGQVRDKESGLLAFATFVKKLMNYGLYIEYLYPVAVLVFGLSLFVYKPMRTAVVDVFSIIPLIKSAVTNFQSGVWCRYVALMASAGIPLQEAERLLRTTLQPSIAEAFEILIREQNRGWAVATTYTEEDPRARIPRVVMSFIRAGGQSGDLDGQLNLAATYQLDVATGQFEVITKLVGLLVMLIVAGGVLFMGSQVYLSRL